MNEKTRKNKEYEVFQVSYIKEAPSFLKEEEDFTLEYYGKPLDEFISSDFNWMDGVLFKKKDINSIGSAIYIAVKSPNLRGSKICIQNSEIFFIVYTQCQIDEVVLFFVWHFETHMVTESREAWETKYNLVPGACCLKNFSTSLSQEYNQELERSTDQGALADAANKKCHFKNQYVACDATVFPHFVNPENPKAVEFLKTHPLNIQVNMDLTFGPLKDTPEFCYGGEKPGLCTSLYDSIVFDETTAVITHHNMEEFFSDAIATCFIYQNTIKPVNCQVQNIQHSFIGFSLFYEIK